MLSLREMKRKATENRKQPKKKTKLSKKEENVPKDDDLIKDKLVDDEVPAQKDAPLEKKDKTISKEKYIDKCLTEWSKMQIEKAPLYIESTMFLNSDNEYKKKLSDYFSRMLEDGKGRSTFSKCWQGTEDEVSLVLSQSSIEYDAVALLLNTIDKYNIRDDLIKHCNENNLEFDEIYNKAGEKLWCIWSCRLRFLVI